MRTSLLNSTTPYLKPNTRPFQINNGILKLTTIQSYFRQKTKCNLTNSTEFNFKLTYSFFKTRTIVFNSTMITVKNRTSLLPVLSTKTLNKSLN